MSASPASGKEATQKPVQLPGGFSKRTKVACKACHQRRVKCDATKEQACWHCRLRCTRCELIESRRGKYVRKKRASSTSRKASLSVSVATLDPAAAPAASGAQSPSDGSFGVNPGAGAGTGAMNDQEHGLLTPQAGHGDTRLSLDTAGASTISLERPLSPPTTVGRGDDEGPEMLYTRILEGDSAASPPGTVPEKNVRYFYMGDPFSLAFVVRSLSTNPAINLRLHHPVPPMIVEHAHGSAEGRKGTDPSVLAALNAYRAFELPPAEVSDKLVRLYFDAFHPAYPVLDRHEFFALYRANQAPLLVLQTIYYLALTICSEETLRAAGYADRFGARRTVYLRAKALYDVGFEKNKVTVIAVLFLFGFWWEGPEDQKDSWHWLGAAISLAQTLGLHRSTANSGMSHHQRSMLKRIWWSIYVRDRHAAAALGRPCRIHDDDCDVEMLDEDDFSADLDVAQGSGMEYEVAYAIEMARLAQILGRILRLECTPRRKAAPSTDLYRELLEWEVHLPPVLRRTAVDGEMGAPYWSCMLYANYHNCQILLLRPKGFDPMPSSQELVEKSARVATDSITRIAEDLLSAGTMNAAQLHLVPALFAALSIHTVVIQRCDGIQKQLTENRVRQCILALGELARGWPVAGWILQLFVNLMKKLTGQATGLGTHHLFSNGSSSMVGNGGNGGNGITGGIPAMQQAPHDELAGTRPLVQLPFLADNGQVPFVDTSDAVLGQTNQMLTDILWAPLVSEYDCDFMFGNTQVSSSFI